MGRGEDLWVVDDVLCGGGVVEGSLSLSSSLLSSAGAVGELEMVIGSGASLRRLFVGGCGVAAAAKPNSSSGST